MDQEDREFIVSVTRITHYRVSAKDRDQAAHFFFEDIYDEELDCETVRHEVEEVLYIVIHPSWGYLAILPADGICGGWSQERPRAIRMTRTEADHIVARCWPGNVDVDVEEF